MLVVELEVALSFEEGCGDADSINVGQLQGMSIVEKTLHW